jgi:hypothetical protein
MSDSTIDVLFGFVGGLAIGLVIGAGAMLTHNGYEWLDKNNCREISKGVVLCAAFEQP